MLFKKEPPGSERRNYIRLDSVFPVEFRVLSADAKHSLSDILQGFTNNISKGGVCLEINNLKPELAKLIQDRSVIFDLDIEMPLRNLVKAKAKVAWVKELVSTEPNKYLIGLAYEEIGPQQNSRLMRYAWAKKLFAPTVFTVIFILGVAFVFGTYLNVKLIKGNKALVGQLIKIIQETSIAKQEVKKINKEKEQLQLNIEALELHIQNAVEEKTRTKEVLGAERMERLTRMTEKLIQERDALQKELGALQEKESTVTEELLRLDKKKGILEKANLDKMYQWLKIHQNPRTGLIMSFEGDSDIANWAFTYDQALAIQAYTNFSDFERAKKALDFFLRRAQRVSGKFINAYYVNDGGPAEYTVHCGPNIWLGIAILQYTKKSQDATYFRLAEEIAEGILDLQAQDKEGGLRGGPEVRWYSTEHNLDAYAFFNMLYKITAKQKYALARDKILDWLVKHTYDRMDIPVRRGKGDSTIATDTYAWSIAAVGPEKLEEIGMNPDRIVEFAEENCSVIVNFLRPEGKSITIKGFDFAPQRNVARGGVVSSEWTAQMVMAFKIMREFYDKKGMNAKAHAYALKADAYMAELGNMIISSPSASGQGESCLPYATQDYVDTGHGWMTPKGRSTGSVAGTAYAIFAYYNQNPLELKD